MRIDLIITELDVGGAERCCAALAKYLHSNSHQVRLIALGKSPSPDRDSLLRELKENSIEVHFLRADSWRWALRIRSRLRDLIQSDVPDIAQSFLWHANVVAASVYSSKNVPLIGGARVREPRSWRAVLSRWAARKMHRIVCVSQDVADWCAEFERIPRDKLIVIPNGVDTDFKPQAIANRGGVPSSVPLLLFVGRLTHQKGADILLRDAESILQQLPFHHVVLLGDGPMRVNWDTLRNASSYRSRIHVLGQRDDVLSWMREAKLLLLPTRYEGMPNVVLEAMSAGLPVAVPKVEGVAELLGDQTETQTVGRDDWKAWTSLVIELAKNERLRAELSAANRKRSVERFRLSDQLARYEKLYGDSITK